MGDSPAVLVMFSIWVVSQVYAYVKISELYT